MEKSLFVDQVVEQLYKMSEKEKDEWILKRARLLDESEQQGFMMSLTGEKMITYMPSVSEIDEFCDKVQSGDIYVEYETHYYEFDDDGRYMNDWKVWHNDPQRAFPFLNRVFEGCQDLCVLGEYKTAAEILNKVCKLRFQVMEAEDSEDCCEDSLFTIPMAGQEGLFSLPTREIGDLWIDALLSAENEQILFSEEKTDYLCFADQLLGVFTSKLCEKLFPSDFKFEMSEELLEALENALKEKLAKTEAYLANVSDERGNWHIKYDTENKISRLKALILNIQMKCKKNKNEEAEQKNATVLKGSWKQICELLEALRYERYIDDQWEIEEIGNICEALVRRDRFGEEDWKLRKKVLEDIVGHDYYNDYGCYDAMSALAGKLCISEQEYLEYADILNQYRGYEKEAAELYKKYGNIKKYVLYLESHLEKSSEEYVELARYYDSIGNDEEARTIAEQGLEKCKDDLTELFVYLLQDAKKYGDEVRYKKYYASAKRRKRVEIGRINEVCN